MWLVDSGGYRRVHFQSLGCGIQCHEQLVGVSGVKCSHLVFISSTALIHLYSISSWRSSHHTRFAAICSTPSLFLFSQLCSHCSEFLRPSFSHSVWFSPVSCLFVITVDLSFSRCCYWKLRCSRSQSLSCMSDMLPPLMATSVMLIPKLTCLLKVGNSCSTWVMKTWLCPDFSK